ncbi:MAG TPA: SAM-dependent methyltransferase [Alphaproteobacteria bacterium]|nr:SAM-dependent methyltransferase [Alphaproteobacteria bacterium]
MSTLLISIFRRIVRQGRLKITDWRGRAAELGDGKGALIAVRLTDAGAGRALLTNPQMALGELYMDGRLVLESGTIVDLLDLLMRNIGQSSGPGHIALWATLKRLARPLTRRNWRLRAQQNVAHHYDLTPAFYDLFLDSDRQYSCAFFESPSDTIEQAQQNKKRRIAAKLALKPGHTVLDIGSGFGGLGLHLAQHHGAQVTGITLSKEQLAIARARASDAGLSTQAQFALRDYRDTAGPFDRIVSVGMFEHVGVKDYGAYFAAVARLLKDDGVALVHSIGRADGPGVTNPWIAKYIFPGGYTPALSEVLPVIEQAGLMVTDIEILRLHYAMTLVQWRERFMASRDKAVALYDERFARMWEFYLAGAEMGFRHQGLMVFQIQLAKRVDALPIVRDYMMPSVAAAPVPVMQPAA